MEYEKTIKTRCTVAVAVLVIGIALTVCGFILGNGGLLSSGVAFVWVAVEYLRKNKKLLKNKELLKKAKISEKDERNILLSDKAGALTCVVTVVLISVAWAVLDCMNVKVIATWTLPIIILGMLAVFGISYFICSKKY